MRQIILASTSPYRTALLKKTHISFQNEKPAIDEDQLKQKLISEKKTPLEIAENLSLAKGQSIHSKHPEDIIISGDQLIDFQGQIIGKPHTIENAINQLTLMNNQKFRLITATTILYKEQVFRDLNITQFHMRNLTKNEIQEYIKIDNPLDCAGSCKIEDHGITLFSQIECSDFTAIQGLPVIWTTSKLKELGYELFKK